MRLRILAAIGLGMLAVSAAAHHSFAMFDMKKDVTVVGTVTEFRWTNPHAWAHIDVDDKGTKTNWAFEMTSPNNLVLGGWRRSSLKVGEKVTVTYHPLVNGKAGGSLVKIQLPDGKILENK